MHPEKPRQSKLAMTTYAALESALQMSPPAPSTDRTLTLAKTADGLSINGITVAFKQLFAATPEFLNWHRRQPIEVYAKMMAAIVGFMQMTPVGAHHTPGDDDHCFNDSDATGGVGFVHSHPDALGPEGEAFHKQLTYALFSNYTCGKLAVVNCTNSTLANLTEVANFLYQSPGWYNGCVKNTTVAAGGFSMNDIFHLKHVKCILDTAQSLLGQLAYQETLAIEKQHNNGGPTPAPTTSPTTPHSSAVGDTFLAFFIIGMVACCAYNIYVQSTRGYLPLSRWMSKCKDGGQSAVSLATSSSSSSHDASHSSHANSGYQSI